MSGQTPARLVRLRESVGLGMIVALFFLRFASGAIAQIVSPADLSITHNLSDGDQAFPETVWSVNNPSSVFGARATISCQQFGHVVLLLKTAEARLGVRVVSASGTSGVAVPIATSQTNGSLTSAAVVVTLPRSSSAQIGLSTTMVGRPFNTMATGTYRTTVTGTLTAN